MYSNTFCQYFERLIKTADVYFIAKQNSLAMTIHKVEKWWDDALLLV